MSRRGWRAVGIDYVPGAIEAAKRQGGDGATYVVGDVTALPTAELGTFDFFLDIGCFQGFDAAQRRAEGAGVTASANPNATILMLAFGPTGLRSLLGGVSRQDVADAFPGWEMLSIEAAETGQARGTTTPAVWRRSTTPNVSSVP